VAEGGLRIDEPAGVRNFDAFWGFPVDPAQSLVTGETVVYAVQYPSNLEDLGVIRRIVGGWLRWCPKPGCSPCSGGLGSGLSHGVGGVRVGVGA
jgi:hypothetical protein